MVGIFGCYLPVVVHDYWLDTEVRQGRVWVNGKCNGGVG